MTLFWPDFTFPPINLWVMPPMNVDEFQLPSRHYFNSDTVFNPATCRSERLHKHLKARNDGVPIPTETPEEKEMLDAVRKIETKLENKTSENEETLGASMNFNGKIYSTEHIAKYECFKCHSIRTFNVDAESIIFTSIACDTKGCDGVMDYIPRKGGVVISKETKDVGAHYRYQYNGINLDPYRIIKVYGITEPAAQQALKKILCAGKRGHNTVIQDIDDVINAMNRWKEMILEDNELA